MQKAKISKPNPEALTERGLHQIMLKLDIPSRQPLLVNWGLLSLTFITNYLLWRFVNLRTAFVAGITFVSTVLIDLVLLRQLPKRRISYGPIGSQLLIMLLPRIGVSALSLLFSFWKSTIGLAMMIALQLMGTISYLWGMAFEPHRLNLTHLTIKSPHLPKNAPPIRILHISDIHLERLTKREDKILELIETAQPELIIITGDYLNLSYTKDPISIEQVRGLLSKIHATYGVYAILGSPPVDVAGVASQHFDDSHVRLLRHDMIEVDLGEGRNLTLLGMDCSHDMPYDEQQFEMLIAQKTKNNTTIFLYHSPELMPLVQKFDVDLFLCGHTHGGQVRVPFYGAVITSAMTGKRYEMGRYDENGTTLYVSRGVGLEGMSAPRIRLFCPPEMTLIEIEGTEFQR